MFQTNELEQDALAPSSPRVRPERRRNHWATRNPDDFIRYPRLKPLGYLEECRLIRQAQNGDLTARNEVWMHYARLALAVVNEFHFPEELLSDAVQEGCIGIKRAIEKFDIDRLNSFSTYAWPWIQQHIQRYLASRSFALHFPSYLFRDYLHYRRELRACRDQADVLRVEREWRERDESRYLRLRRIHALIETEQIEDVAARDHPAVTEAEADDWSPPPETCRDLVSRLHSRDREIIELRFGFVDGRARSLQEIGDLLGLTRERIRQIEHRALKKLRKLARKHHPHYATDLPDDEATPCDTPVPETP